MKKIFLIAALVAGTATHSFSQARFGIQAGGNISFTQVEIDGDDDLSNKPKFGVVAGFLADIPFGPISFRPEINFVQKGYKNESTNSYTVLGVTSTTTSTNKVRLNYLEVPLNFVYNIPAGSGKVYVGLGPNFGFGINGKDRSEFTSNTGGFSTSGSESRDVKFDGDADDPNGNYSHLKRFDLGGNLLAGYTCDMGLTFGIGFTLGLSDVSPNKLDSNDPNADGFTQKNHSLNVKVGYLFGGASSKKSTTTNTTGIF